MQHRSHEQKTQNLVEDQRKQLVAHAFLPVRWLQGGKGPKHAKVETMEGLVGKGLLGEFSCPVQVGTRKSWACCRNLHRRGGCVFAWQGSSISRRVWGARMLAELSQAQDKQSVRHRGSMVSIVDGERFLFWGRLACKAKIEKNAADESFDTCTGALAALLWRSMGISGT